MNTIYLDEKCSTTKLLTQDKPVIVNNPEDKFESVLFLPEAKGRKGKGGLKGMGMLKTPFKDKPLIIIVIFNTFNFDELYLNIRQKIIKTLEQNKTLNYIKILW